MKGIAIMTKSKTNEKYYESDAKREWQKKNALVLGVKLQRKGDKELIEYVEKQEQKGFSKSNLLKTALLEYMSNHPEGTE